MKRLLNIILLVVLSIVLTGCDLIGGSENSAPVIDGSTYMVFSINSDEPDWTKLITASDDEDGAIRIVESMVDSNVDFTTVGEYTVEFYVKDSTGVTTSFIMNVEIVDDRVYTFSIIGSNDITLEVNNEFIDPGVLALDLDGNVSIYNVNGLVNFELVGVYTLLYSMDGVDDPLVRTVNVVDTTAPVIKLDTVNLLFGEHSDISWIDYIDIVTDNYSQIINLEVEESTINYNETGIYTVTIKATDEAGNESTATFSVALFDIVLLITGDSIIEHEVHTDYIDLGAIAINDSYTQFDVTVTTDLNVDVLGSYTVTYTVVGFENITLSRIVTVTDTTAPVIDVSDQIIYKVNTDIDWSSSYFSITDNYDTDIEFFEVEDNVIYGTAGVYTVILGANDSSNNQTTVTFNVTIPDTMITILSELPSEQITITFWHVYGQGKSALLNDLIAEFELLYPNITVESIAQGAYSDLKNKTISSISAGVTPDLLVGYPDHFAEYLNGNAIIPLDDFIEHDTWGVDLTDFISSYVDENQQYQDGIMYSMPYSKSTEMLIYNKTVFDAHGITLPTDRAVTFEELEVYADIIVGNGPNQCEFLINYDSSANLFINASRQWAGEYTNMQGDILVNNTNTITMLNYLDTLFDSNTLVLPLEWNQSYGSTNFLKGDVCMTVGSTAGISYNVPHPGNEGKFGQFELGITQTPQHNGGINSSNQQGPNIAVMANTTDAERLASWLLIKYLTSTEATAQWAMNTGYLPVRHSAYNSDLYQAFLDTETFDQDYKYDSMTANAAYAQVEFFKFDPGFAKLITSSDVRGEAGLALQSIFTKTRTISEAIQHMLDQLGWVQDVPTELPELPGVGLIGEASTALLLTSLSNVTEDLVLPTSGLHNSVITWTSSDLNIITGAGLVTRPAIGEDNVIVTLTATITIGDESLDKHFTVRVIATEVDITFTISEINSLLVNVDDNVVVTGVIFGIVENTGFQIFDGTGFIYVYVGSYGDEVLGDTVKVTGKKTLYYGLPEIVDITSIEIISTGGAKPTYETTSIIDLFDEDIFDTIYWSKPIIITGIVSLDVNNTPIITETNNAGEGFSVLVYYKSSPDRITDLVALVGNMVTVEVIVYGYHDFLGVWRVVVAENSIITSVDATDTELVLWEAGQLDLGNLSEVTDDLVLNTTGILVGTTITWSSDNEAVISTSGEVNSVLGSDTTVVLSAEITFEAGTFIKHFTVIVKDSYYGVIPITVAEALSTDAEIIPDGTLTTDPIYVRGIVTAILGSSKIVLQDATGGPGITTYHSGFNNDNIFAIGDEIIIRGTHKIYYGLQELTKLTLIEVVSSNNAVQLSTTITVSDIVADIAGPYSLQGLNVILTNLEVVDVDYDGKPGYIVVKDSLDKEIIFSAYDIPYSDSLVVGDILTEVTVVIWDYYWDATRVIVTAYPALSDADAVAYVSSNLTIATTAQVDMTLPLLDEDFGVAISWASDTEAVISTTGVVVQPATGTADITVVLTATFTINDATATETYTVVVPQAIVDTVQTLFISEYIEASGINKAIEIYNPTDVTIDLSIYSLLQAGGSAGEITYTLTGTLAPGAVYVVCNDSVDTALSAECDVELPYPSVAHFNGNDHIQLLKNGVVIDQIGVVADAGGIDFAANVTLVRLPSITSGSLVFDIAEWTSYSVDTFTYVGSHTVD